MRSLLDYATDDELGEYRQQVLALRRAEAETKKVYEAMRRVDTELFEAEQGKVYDLRAAGQRAMGSDVVIPATNAARRVELREQSNGLRMLQKDAEDNEKHAKGNLRRAAHQLVKACAERCAEDYVKAAQTLGWCWTQLAAANAIGGGQTTFLADLALGEFHVPGSESVEVLKQQTRLEYGKPAIISRDRLTRPLERAPAEIRAHAQDIVGTWPL